MLDMNKINDIIVYLQDNPLASNNELSSELKLTLPTIRKYLKNIITDNNESVISGTSGVLNFNKLGLEIVTFLLDLEPNQDVKNKMFELGESHPYKLYQNTCYGSVNGFLLQFSMPEGKSNSILEMYSQIKSEMGIKDEIIFLRQGETLNSRTNYKFWNSGEWKFNFKNWISQSDELAELNTLDLNSKINLNKIKLPSLITLRELSMNARRKQSQLLSDIQLSKDYNQEEKNYFTDNQQRNLSRYVNFINDEELIQFYQVRYNQKKLNLDNQICIFGKMNQENQNTITRSYKNKASILPFRTQLSFNGDDFFWNLNLPPEQITDFMRIIYDLSSEFNTVILDDNPTYQRNYPIWHRNFKHENHKSSWRRDREWLIDVPLEVIN